MLLSAFRTLIFFLYSNSLFLEVPIFYFVSLDGLWRWSLKKVGETSRMIYKNMNYEKWRRRGDFPSWSIQEIGRKHGTF